MKKISAEIVADSVNKHGNRITTFLLTFPRFILAELNTHRMFSRNSASSRAIPFEKMLKMVEEDPFIPIAWQKDHRGMQGIEYFTDELSIQFAKSNWLTARDNAIKGAMSLHSTDNGYGSVTKQLCNRLLEPFMWYTVLVTATEWDNFFELRCPQYTVNWYPSRRPEALEPTQTSFKSRKDAIRCTEGECNNWKEQDWRDSNESQAEIHIQALAEAMWDAMNESIPKELKADEWHIPFGDRFDNDGGKFVKYLESIWKNKQAPTNGNTKERIKISTARCARLSYMTFDGEIDYKKDIKLHDTLLESQHLSPFEHCAKAMNNEEYSTFIKGKCVINPYTDEVISPVMNEGWCNNFKGFIQYRYLIENNIQI